MKNDLAILIVSFNRKDYVLQNLVAIKKLEYTKHDIILFDNGSSDGTTDTVKLLYPYVHIIYSNENLGGAGGFAKGMEYAYNQGYEYIWCLDDDGCPSPTCLTRLIEESHKYNKQVILGANVVSGNQEVWPAFGKYDAPNKKIFKFSETEKQLLKNSKNSYETASVALVGLLVNRHIIDKIGYPDSLFFIAGDDVEYCLRAWKNGIPVVLVQTAIISHPINKKNIKFLFKNVDILVSPPWKMYYMVRNNIYTALKYFKKSLVLKLILFHFYTMIYLLLHEKNKKNVTKSTLMGLYHGIIGKLGKYNLN